ncbi:TetR/AcrR family transcriptional regulator [Dactylosporangium aurantiacum]|uniref:TetR/AcrR family transcriptional regulator n=1 Tax=Dactylosporangium aurantiacum TaxID=35754 RepID=UPI001FE04828|nr:TetR/AcrR family transcriptional regulator [Dactylosporangium aurantiacum]MDG6107678.1 helix-turn-helix domain containing protein [Dactylosporangium aurantiacum]
MAAGGTGERADAARNRALVLSAAEHLFATRDPDKVTMEDIARAAGVGRATLYRRYPDRAAIAVALLDQHERVLQEELLRGAPPLGPGATPAERLAAFYDAMTVLLERHGHLALGAEIGQVRYTTGAYGFWRAHVHTLLVAAGTSDPEILADVLLAPLAPDLYRFQRVQRGLSRERISASLTSLAHRLLSST